PGIRTHVVIVLRWTSSPATRSSCCSMAGPPQGVSPGPMGTDEDPACSACSRQQCGGPTGPAPTSFRTPRSQSDDDVGGPRCQLRLRYFHAAWVSAAHDTTLPPSIARSTYRKYASHATFGRRLAAGPFSPRQPACRLPNRAESSVVPLE